MTNREYLNGLYNECFAEEIVYIIKAINCFPGENPNHKKHCLAPEFIEVNEFLTWLESERKD